jgi:hypothetical protein
MITVLSMQKFQSRVEKPAAHTPEKINKGGFITDPQRGQCSCTWKFITHSKQLPNDHLQASFTNCSPAGYVYHPKIHTSS